MSLRMLQLQLNAVALVRFLDTQALNRRQDEDLGYATHAWLSAVFGMLAPKPFRLMIDSRNLKPPKLLGYSSHTAERLILHARSYAEPFALAVCNLDQDLADAEMPSSEQRSSNRRLGFEVLTCPVARKSRKGTERDLFLQRLDIVRPNEALSREQIYHDWLVEQTVGACTIESVELAGFRLVRQLRRGKRSPEANRKMTPIVRPQALLRGGLRVTDAEAFSQLLGRGIGPHRSFGYGMLLLRPA